MPLTLTKDLPYTVTIHGEPVRLSFKRMTVEEFAIFDAEFTARQDERTPDAAESAGATRSLSAAARAALEANIAWLRDTFDRYVTVAAGDLEMAGEAITGGKAFFDAVGAVAAVRQEVLSALYFEQCLTAEQKKTLRSPRASKTGSPDGLPMEGSGAPPAPAAAPVESAGSVASGPAIDLGSASSGAMAPSSSAPALSAS